MTMGRLGVALCVLLVFASVEAGRRKSSHRHHSKTRRLSLPSAPECPSIQNFDPRFKYKYEYETTVESRNNNTVEATSGKKIMCHDVLITVPKPCVGTLSVRNCTVYESALLPNGSLVYSQVDTRLHKMMYKNKMYFHFNKGEISTVFYDGESEPSDVMNFKRGILSALQFKFNSTGLQKPVHERFEVPEVNIFGAGNSSVEVKTVQGGFAKTVEVSRDLDMYELPWNRRQWATLRTIFEGSDLADFISDVIVDQAENITGNSSQSCMYKLDRGRQVKNVECIEFKPVNLYNNTIFQLLRMNQQGNYTANTTIQLRMTQTSVEPMDHKDRLHRVELARFQERYKEESLMFEEQWEEAMDSAAHGFEPIDAIDILVTRPENRSSAVLFAKLARHITRARESKLEETWQKILRKYPEDSHDLEKATNIWVQLLNGCNCSPYWCPLPSCETNMGCQNVFSQFIKTNTQHGVTESIKMGVLKAISTMPNPNITIIDAALEICRVNTTGKNIMVMGKAMARYVQNPEAELQHPILQRAKLFLRRLIESCTIEQQSAYEEKRIKIATMKSFAALMEHGEVAKHRLVQCATEPRAPKELSLTAIRSLQDLRLTEQPLRNQIFEVLENQDRPVTVRLASYLLIITKEPTVQEIERISQTMNRESEPRGLRYYIQEHIKSQVVLRNTSFCELSETTIRNIMTAIREGHLNINIDIDSPEHTYSEKRYEIKQNVTIPVLNKELECDIVTNLVFSQNSMVPILVNVTISTEIGDSNITLFETKLDFSKIVAVLDPLFGDNGVFPKQDLERFFNMPISQLLRLVMRDQPLLARDELESLTKIQSEGELAYSMLMLKNKTPFEAKILGVPLSYRALFDIPMMKDFNLLNIWKIVDVLEKGWEFEGIIADQPALGHLASPSSIGWPHIFRVEAEYFVHMHTRIVVPVQRIILTGEGDITVRSDPDIRGNLMMTQHVQMPLSFSCGSGYQLSAGHSSKINGSIEVRRDHIKIDLEPISPKTEVFSIRGDDVIVNNTRVVVVERPENECERRCIWPSTTCTNDAWYYKACLRPNLNFGLYYETTSQNQYHFLLEWEYPRTHRQQDNEEIYRVSFSSFDSWPSDTAAWSWTGRYNPTEKAVQFTIESREVTQVKLEANALVYRNSEVQNMPFEQVFASFNVSRRQSSSDPLAPVSINKILVRRQERIENLMAELESFIGYPEIEEPQLDENKVMYSIESDLQLYREEQRMSARGTMYLNKNDGGYSMNMKVKQGALDDRSNRKLCTVNVTSSRVREHEMSGFITEVRMEEMTSLFPSPLTFLNRFDRFNFTTKLVNDTQNNNNQDMALEAYVHNSPEPYYVSSFSQLRSQEQLQNQSQNIKPYKMNTAVTINWAQLQLDVVSPNASEISSVQTLVLPSVSIPYSRIQPRQFERMRICECDSELKPVSYVSKVATGVCSNGTYYFKTNATKVVCPAQQEQKRQSLYNVEIMVSPVECPICHNIIFEINGITLQSEYANKKTWQGHKMLVEMRKSYLEKLPISNKTKDIIHRYSKSRSLDKVRLGYILKANQSESNYFYEVGYHLGDKKLIVLANVTLPESEPISCSLRFNVTCNECFFFTNTSFKTGFGVFYNESIPRQWELKQASRGNALDIAFEYQQPDGIRTGFGLYSEMYRNIKLIHMASSVNFTFSAGHSYIRYLYPEERYVYVTGFNMTRIQDGDEARPTVYRIAYPLSFYEGAPWMIGNWTYSQQTAKQGDEISSICNVGENCMVYTLDMAQNEKCKSFTPFYESRGLMSPYKSANCSYQKMSMVISPHNTWNVSFEFNGRNNPDFLLQLIRFDTMQDNSGNMVQDVTVDLARHYYPSPMQLRVSYTYTDRQQSSDFELVLDSEEIKSTIRRESRQSMTVNVTTQHIPVEIDCQYSADLTSEERTTISMRDCSVNYPYLTTSPVIINADGWYKSLKDNRLNVRVTNSSGKIVTATTNMEHGRGKNRLYCGQENDENSLCDVKWTYNGMKMTLDARINTTVLNHTTTSDLSGLQSFNIMDWVANMKTSTSVQSIKKCSLCHNCTTSISRYQYETIIRENKLELVRTVLNSTQWPSLRTAGSLYFHYISNNTADLDILMSTDIKNRGKIEMGMYRGLNQPDNRLHIQNASASYYLEAYYFLYRQCSKNFTFVSKNLYDRSSVQHRQLMKMETNARSNYWPISCDEQSRVMFAQLFPQTPITPFCAEDMEVRIRYDFNKHKEVKVELDRQESRLLTVIYHQQEQKHNLKAICLDEKNATCHMTAVIGSKDLSLTTKLNLTDVKHNATITLNIRPNSQHEEILDFHMNSNNTFVVYKQPVVFNTTVRYTPEAGWYVYSKMNATEYLDNVILIQNGTIKELYLYGESIMILSKPRSWNVTFVNTTSSIQLVGHVQLDRETEIRTIYYEGQNQQNASLYEPRERTDRYIKGVFWNYTSCNRKSLFKWTRVLSSKHGRQLVMRSEADIDMWPFMKVRRIFYTPGFFSCPMCIGELKYTAVYNTTDDLKFVAEVISGKTSMLSMNYTLGNETQQPGYYLLGKTVLIQDILQESSPHMLLSTNVTILSGQNFLCNVTVERKGYSMLNFKVKEQFKYGSSNEWEQRLTVDSSLISIYLVLENAGNGTVLSVNYTLPKSHPIEFQLILRDTDLEIKNLTIRTVMSEWHIKRMILTFVRDETHILGGLKMRDLDMEIRTNLHYKEPDVTKVTGDASFVFGGKWYVNIVDNTREKFVILWNLTPSPVTEMRTSVLMNLPFIKMNVDGNTTWSYDELKNDYNCSLMLAHPLTRKLLPVFDLIIVDDLTKTQTCVYHGKMYWESNIWNPFFSTFHINPVMNLVLNPKTNDLNEMKVNLVMGEYYVNHTMDFTNEIQKVIPIFRNLSICIPREVTGNAVTKLLFMDSTHSLKIKPKKYEMTSDLAVLLRLPKMYVMKPIFNCSNVMKFTMNNEDYLVGSSEYNGYVMTPHLTPFKADITIKPVTLPSGRQSRKLEMSYRLGEEYPLMLNVTAPNTQNVRRITARAFGSEILSSNLEVAECSLSCPIMPELLCIPREMNMKNINANIPVARMLRQFPILNVIVPDTELLNFVLRDSYMTLVTEKRTEEDWTIRCKSRLSGPTWSERISEELSRLNLPHFEISADEPMNSWYFDTNITRTPTKINCVFDTRMNTTLIEQRFRLHWIPMFTIREIVFQIKTKGIIEKYFPLDIDWEFTLDPVTKKWTFVLRSYNFQINDQVKGKISIVADSSLKNTSISWNATVKHHPVLSHLIGFSIEKKNTTGNWSMGAWLKNAFLNVKSSSMLNNSTYKLLNLSVEVPTTSKNINVTFKVENNKEHKLVIAMKNGEDVRYVCNSSMKPNGSVSWNCSKEQLLPEQGWQQRERHSLNQQLDVSPSGLFSLVRKSMFFDYENITSHSWIEKTLETIFGLTDKTLRETISKYVVNETRVFRKKINELVELTSVESWNTWVKDLVEILPSLIPAEKYLNQTFGQLKFLSSDKFKMILLSNNGSLALRYNITCPQKSSDIMLQLNFTTSLEEYPVVNISIVTPFSDQHLMLDIGALAKPIMLGIKSFTSKNRLQLNFTCTTPAQSCATAEFILSNDHRYRCVATKQQTTESSWNVVCHSVNGQQQTEVSRFVVTSPSFVKTMKSAWSLTMNYLEGHLERYLDRIMNIPMHSTLSTDLTQAVTHSYENIKNIFFMIFPENAHQLYQLEKLAKEGAIISIDQIKKMNNGNYSINYYKLIKSTVDYLSTVNNSHGLRIPLISLNLDVVAAKFYVELGKEGKKNVSFVLDTSVLQKPDLDQKLRADVWYAKDKPFVRVAINNSYIWSYVNVCLANKSLVNASIGFPQSRSSVNVTYVGEPNAPNKRYEIRFVDTADAKYVCDMEQQSETIMRTVCRKQHVGELETRPICSFETSVDALNLEELVLKGIFLVPEIYVAAMKPTEFKDYLRKTFVVSDEESLNIIADYLSQVSHEYIERLHRDLVQFFADKITDLPSLIQKDWALPVVKKIMSHPRLIDITRGQSSVMTAGSDLIRDVTPDVITKLVRTVKTISQTCQDVRVVARGFYKLFNTTFEPFTRVYSIENFVEDTYELLKMMNKISYVCHRIMFTPQETKCALTQLYRETYIREYIMSLFKLGGPITELITTPRSRTVISFKEQTYELPPMGESTSNCRYLYLTEPFLNSYSIISQGSSLLLVFPNITMEMASDRRVYVTTHDAPRREVNLPYFSDEISCMMTKRQTIECKSMEYSVMLKTGQNNRVRRTITIYLPQYAIGVMGVESYEPSNVTMYLPNGTEARNSAQLMNAYKLSSRRECTVPERQEMILVTEISTCGPLCERLFRSPELQKANRSESEMRKAYLDQCKRHCHNDNKAEACEIVNEFTEKLRLKKILVEDVQECMPCSVNGPQTFIQKSEVYILVSMSQDRIQTDPKRSIRKLTTKVLDKMQREGFSESKVGIIAYGGNGNSSKPFISVVNGVAMSQSRQILTAAIQNINFTGPDYRPVTTVGTLAFLSATMKGAPSGIAKAILVVASENEQKNMGSIDMTPLINDLRGDYASVLLWSPMNNDQCRARHEDIVLGTGGTCLRSTESSEDEMSAMIVKVLKRRMGNAISCQCETANLLTGELKSKCVPRNLADIQF